MKKQDLIEILNSITTNENKSAIDKVVAKIKKLDDGTIEKICAEKNYKRNTGISYRKC